MSSSGERSEQFRAEIARLGVHDPATGRDRLLLRLGVVAMVAGVAIAVAAYFGSHGTTNALSQRDYLIVAVIGLTVSVVGSAVFVRYSLAQFLRFWLARLIYEQQSQTDRIIDRDA